MGQSVVLATALFVSMFISHSGLAGLALTSSLSVVGLMNWATRQGTELELGMNSVERMSEYLTHESERPAIIHDNRCRCEPLISPILRYIAFDRVWYSKQE